MRNIGPGESTAIRKAPIRAQQPGPMSNLSVFPGLQRELMECRRPSCQLEYTDEHLPVPGDRIIPRWSDRFEGGCREKIRLPALRLCVRSSQRRRQRRDSARNRSDRDPVRLVVSALQRLTRRFRPQGLNPPLPAPDATLSVASGHLRKFSHPLLDSQPGRFIYNPAHDNKDIAQRRLEHGY